MVSAVGRSHAAEAPSLFPNRMYCQESRKLSVEVGIQLDLAQSGHRDHDDSAHIGKGSQIDEDIERWLIRQDRRSRDELTAHPHPHPSVSQPRIMVPPLEPIQIEPLT